MLTRPVDIRRIRLREKANGLHSCIYPILKGSILEWIYPVYTIYREPNGSRIAAMKANNLCSIETAVDSFFDLQAGSLKVFRLKRKNYLIGRGAIFEIMTDKKYYNLLQYECKHNWVLEPIIITSIHSADLDYYRQLLDSHRRNPDSRTYLIHIHEDVDKANTKRWRAITYMWRKYLKNRMEGIETISTHSVYDTLYRKPEIPTFDSEEERSILKDMIVKIGYGSIENGITKDNYSAFLHSSH